MSKFRNVLLLGLSSACFAYYTLSDADEVKAHDDAKNITSTTDTATVENVDADATSELAAASDAMVVGDIKKALSIYQAALQKSPHNKLVLIGLARTQLLLGNYDEGNKMLNYYKTEFGEDDGYLTERARYFAFNGNPNDAIKIADDLLIKTPSNQTLLDIKSFAMAHPITTDITETNAIKVAPVLSVPAISAPASIAINTPTTRLAHNRGVDKHGIKAKKEHKTKTIMINTAAVPTVPEAPTVEQDKQTLAMLNRELAPDPDNIRLLKLKADIALRIDDKAAVYNAYYRLFKLDPENKAYLLALARATEQVGMLDKAEWYYYQYTEAYPDEKQAWIEYAFIQSWRGNDRMAVWLLDHYNGLFGKDDLYLAARVRIVAGATRPTEALAIAHDLFGKIPNNYNLNYGYTSALYYHNQPLEMFEAFKKVEQLAPNSPETKGLNAFIKTPYRSNISLEAYDSFDTDTVKIAHSTLAGQYFLSPVTSLLAKLTAERLSATIASGLNPIEGGHDNYLYDYNVGINHRFAPYLALQGYLGYANSSDDNHTMLYQGDAYLNPSDTLYFDLLAKRSFYDQSPLAISLGIKQDLYQVQGTWQPCLQCYLTVTANRADYSDSNHSKHLEVSPVVEVISAEKLNLKIGLDGQWNSYSQQLGNGYYNPANYRFYAITLDAYLKQTDNIGYELSWAIGKQIDETFASFKTTYDISGKAYFGIYEDWYLVFSAGESTRGRGILANPALGTYRIHSFGAQITRRF